MLALVCSGLKGSANEVRDHDTFIFMTQGDGRNDAPS